MASFTSITNRALSLLGQAPIVSLDDKTPESEEVNRVLPFVLDTVFRMHPWSSLRTRKSLAPTTTKPVYGFEYAYNLPADCLRLIEVVSEGRTKYSLEGRQILTNEGPEIFIKYIAEIKDPNKYDGLLREALACYLAYTICERITQSNSKRELAMREFENALNMARSTDSKENPPTPQQTDTWVQARFWR